MLDFKPERFQLSSKLRLVVEQHPSVLSTAIGLFVGCGSRHEESRLQGATHLAEHFFFKGTSQFSAEEISQVIERSGGELNAFTDREFTCFHAYVPRNELKLGLELVLSIVFDSLFDESEFLKEREVVVQELKGYEDSPDDEFWDSLLEVPWKKDSALGRRIAGIAKQVRHFSHEDTMEHIQNRFLSAPMVLVVTSPFEARRIKSWVSAALKKAESMIWGEYLKRPAKKNRCEKPRTPNRFVTRSRIQPFDADQVQLGILFPGVPLSDKNEVAWSSTAAILGAGSSSRLFREIREDRGLAYNTSVQLHSYSDTGLVVGHVVTEKRHWPEAVQLVGEIFRNFSTTVTADEIDFVKSMMEGSVYLNYEGTNNRMESLGRQELLMEKIYTLKEMLQEIRGLKLESVQRVGETFRQLPCFYALGPLQKRELPKLLRTWKGKA